MTFHAGLETEIRRYVAELLQADLLVRWNTRSGDSRPLRTREDLRPTKSHKSGKRTVLEPWFLDFLVLNAMRFAVYHELAHIIRGHLYEEARLTGKLTAKFRHSEAGGPSSDPVSAARWRFFEHDADVVGADLFARMTALETWLDWPLTIRRKLWSYLLFGIGLVFMLLDLSNDEGTTDETHGYPLERFMRVMDTLGASIQRELKLPPAQMTRGASAAVGMLAELAKRMSPAYPKWTLGDRGEWSKMLDEHTRANDAYQRMRRRVLGKRSTFLPLGPLPPG